MPTFGYVKIGPMFFMVTSLVMSNLMIIIIFQAIPNDIGEYTEKP